MSERTAIDLLLDGVTGLVLDGNIEAVLRIVEKQVAFIAQLEAENAEIRAALDYCNNEARNCMDRADALESENLPLPGAAAEGGGE